MSSVTRDALICCGSYQYEEYSCLARETFKFERVEAWKRASGT